ncbi:MAG: prolipoprotein diacylglyceryl transferase [bacterium]|nr:prolipoprotein diacylglyceryl transferase [bacterium]
MFFYVCIVIIGLIINFIINYFELKKTLKFKLSLSIALINSLFMVLGCKALDMIINFKYYEDFYSLSFITNGYMFYGGILAVILSETLFCKIENLSTEDVIKTILINDILLYSIWKIGCFYNGCCAGIVKVPIQLVESIVTLLLYIYEKIQKSSFFNIIITFSIIRIIAFIFRKDIDAFNFYTNIIISIIIICSSIFIKISKKRR